MNVLALETSCDETAAAVVRDGREIRSNLISSQVALHRPYGGVVPELAARRHLELIADITRQALHAARLSIAEIDLVAATYGPGLATALLVGLNTAKGIALAAGKPFVAINHLEAHLYSPLLTAAAAAPFPLVALIVSGGHTILAEVTGIGRHRMLGQTLDDAAGEAFDKVAKLLGLEYPGGPAIERVARNGNPAAIAFPRSMLDDESHNFSFSGLKTAVLYFRRQHPDWPVPDIAASFQEAVVDVLVGKTMQAVAATGARAVGVSGGVSVNGRLRAKLAAACQQRRVLLYVAAPDLCTDNAAMIAALAYHKYRAGHDADWTVEAAPSLSLAEESHP